MENSEKTGCLVIVEVSQKQAYIFSSNSLKDNVTNSSVIAYVTSGDYFRSCAGDLYTPEKNEVYSGGGHSILEFDTREDAVAFVQRVTTDAKRRLPGLELFATVYDCELDPSEPNADKITKLIQQLERKKALRRASFSQGTFGVEKISADTRDATVIAIDGHKYDKFRPDDSADRAVYPKEYERALAFDNLGVTKDESSFIAVVHIDGSAMGKRSELLREEHGQEHWGMYKKTLKDFSESISEDFRNAFSEMCRVVADNIHDGKLGDIKLAEDSKNHRLYFPLRRIIGEGDDICFVTEGRIGVECARIFLECLRGRKNKVDGKPYGACAGVAIVHLKYPFYRAYELAEELCSNAKKYIANAARDLEGVDPAVACAIDWHIELGEMEDDIGATREKYNTADQKRMELRPYLLSGPDALAEAEWARDYARFRAVMTALAGEQMESAKSKIKGLRGPLRAGEETAQNYVTANLIGDLMKKCCAGVYQAPGTGEEQETGLFVMTSDGESRSVLFDAIELMDTFIPLEVNGQ